MSSLRNKIRDRFREIYEVNPNRWIIKEDVCAFARKEGYESETGGRRARELAFGYDATGKKIGISLEKKEVKGIRGQRLTYYRYKPSSQVDMAREERIFDSLPCK